VLDCACRICQQRGLQIRHACNRLLRKRGRRLLLEPLDGEGAQHVDEELLLGSVVVVQGLFRDACSMSDGVHRGALVSQFEKDALGGATYLLAFGACARRLLHCLGIP
jgi:hypothetical protein